MSRGVLGVTGSQFLRIGVIAFLFFVVINLIAQKSGSAGLQALVAKAR